MTRRNKGKTRLKTGNALLHGAGASTWQDRGSIQQGAIFTKNPYYNNDYYRRWQDLVRWYYTDWAAKKIVDIPVQDAFRVEPEIKGLSEEDKEQLIKYKEAMGGRDKLYKAAIQSRLLGGSIVMLGIKDEEDNPEKPIDFDKLDKGDLAFMNVVSVEKISQVQYETDPFSPMYDTPRYYMINGQKVDVSRLLVFDGRPLFNSASMNILQNFRFNPAGFGESVLIPVYDALVRFAGTQEGAYHLVNMASVLLVKCDKLMDLQASNMGERGMRMLEKMAEQISIYRAGILSGKDVDVAQHSATFGSVPELLQTFAQVLAAGSDIPATRFLGQAPGGLNATGESDLENYYNNVASWQNTVLKPNEIKMYNILGVSCFGREKWQSIRPEFDIEYKPLWNLSETEQATIDSTRAQTISLLEQSGYLSREAALEELKARKIFINDIKPEDMPDMSQLGYMTGENPEKTPTADDNNKLFEDIARIGNRFIENAEFKESDHPRDEDGKFTSGGSQQKSSSSSASSPDVDLAKEKKKEFNRTLSDLERNLKKDEDARKKYADIALKKPSELLELGLNTSRIDSMKSWLTKNPDYIPEETRQKYQKEQEEKRKKWDEYDDKLREIEQQKSEYRQKEYEKANDIDSKYPF